MRVPQDEPEQPLGELGPARSLAIPLANGTCRHVSTIDDYVAWYVRLGLVQDKRELLDSKNLLLSELFFDWIKQLQLGCLFAARLARGDGKDRVPTKGAVPFAVPAPWLTHVERGAHANPTLGDKLNYLLDAAVRENEEAAQIVFPDLETPSQLIQLVNNLCAHERWYWNEIPWRDGEPQARLIGLRWILPSGKSVNHALGFANISTMPITRRSPLPALILRTSDFKRTPEAQEAGRVPVHLADMDSRIRPQAKHDSLWERTRQLKADLVEPSLKSAARARITFAIGFREAESLVPPRTVEMTENHQ